MTSVAVSAVALVPATFIASPALAAPITGLSISSPVVNEGGTASFTVTYAGPGPSSTITFTTNGVTATTGTDFTTLPTVPGGSGTNNADYAFSGSGSIVVTVPTVADTAGEGYETFQLVATAGSDSTTATATIVDPKASNITVAPAGVWEGGTASFAVTYTGTTSSGAVNFGTAGHAENLSRTAVKGTDFSATPSVASYTFPGTAAGGTNTIMVTVDTTADGDADETFELYAAGPAGMATGTGTIWQTDATNDIVLGGATTVAETAAGGTQKAVTITATSTNPEPHDVTIPIQTADYAGDNYAGNMATSEGGVNRDYTALGADAAITIPANATSGTATVMLWDDNSDETDTQYFLVKKDAGRPTLGGAVVSAQSSVKIGIKDDDATPVATIGDAGSVVEGNRLIFPLSVTNPSEKGVTLNYLTTGDTQNGAVGAATVTASDNHGSTDTTDVVAPATAQPVMIAKYATTTNLSLVTTTNPSPGGVPTFEGPEGVKVTISEPVSGATSTLGTKATATGTVTDTGSGKALTYSNTSMGAGDVAGRTYPEGNTGQADKKIYVRFSTTSPLPATLNYSFADGTAKNGTDFIGKSGTVTVPADSTKDVTIPVTIIGDTNAEPDETFKLVVTSSSGVVDDASLGEQTFTIHDDDLPPTWTTSDIKVQEGDSGTTLARVPVKLSGPAAVDVSFDASFTPSGSAGTGGTLELGLNDFSTPTATTATIKAGDTVGYFDVPINGDTVYEHDETFNVTLAPTSGSAANVTTSLDTTQSVAKVTVANDDAMPKLTFALGTATEGGSIPVTGTIVGTSQYRYHIGFSVGGGASNPATLNADYTVPDSVATTDINVAPGESGALNKAGNFAAAAGGYTPPVITVLDDAINEPTETIDITASEISSPPSGFAPSSGTAKIADDPTDTPPAVTINDVMANEKDGWAEVPVTLAFTGSATSTVQNVTIPYYTADGTAKVGKDYQLTKGVLTIPPGTMTGTIKVPLINDRDMEPDEVFSVRLGAVGPQGASVISGDATVTIKSDDMTPPVVPSLMVTGPAAGSGSVVLSGKAAPGAEVWLFGAALPETDKKDLKKLGSVKAGPDGMYRFTRSVSTGWAFYAATDAGTTSVRTVKLTQAPSLAVSTTKGKLVAMVGGNPKAAGQTVTIQRKSGSKWVTVASGKTTSSGYKGTWSFKSGTKLTLRALVSGNTGMGINAGYSATKTITIK
ncbi:Calx-beta domain-containing protein [Actinoplanes sp. NPDC020271]|uniref:Calx-beta domain-containing protein n=1 Tax=Actinoplanes sp. NPDC020271 TaxID=3363896 RepID=UPI00379B8616